MIRYYSNPVINLAGVAIGNGWVDPFYQYPSFNQYAVEQGLTNSAVSKVLGVGFELCQFSMLLDIPILSPLICNLASIPIIGNPLYPSFNVFDIRDKCHTLGTCYGENGVENYLNSGKYKAYMNMTKPGTFQTCNNDVRIMLSAFS